ncbi:hypothetical protein BDV96DRAFT_594978 [Lophiotrema nucula]|uniref:Uncharacterized protein n=1 Tax=Lophiotrema nucula TaxID=690887 RepID=A0A6A5ZNF3_9PLEO|nr:hypothetical protein BDV96DRAFT_594978 [Lophiotrema nucula]
MPPAEFFDDDDEWYSDVRYSGARHVRPPPYGRRSDRDFLQPEARVYQSGGHHRSRSTGGSPVPNINIYATGGAAKNDNDTNPRLHAEQRSPAASPRMEARGRSRGRHDDWGLEDQIDELKHELRKNRSRSRSAQHHHYRDESPNHAYDKWQLDRANERLKEAEDKLALEKREDLVKRKMELHYLKDRHEREEEAERIRREEDRFKKDFELKMEKEERKKMLDAQAKDTERKRIIAENTAKLDREAREEKEAREQAVAEYRRKRLDDEEKAKAEKDKVIADFKRKEFEDAQKAKKAKEDLLAQLAIEEQKRKAEEKAQYEAFELMQKQKRQEEKEKRDKQEAELEEAMRKRLAHFGFQENQISAMIKPEEAAKLHQGQTPLNPLRLTHQPTYVKVHRDHLSVDTLQYYDIPFEYDRGDPEYLIILREMDQKETEILFEHTRRLRSRGTPLLIEQRKDHGHKDYAWVRRKRSVSRSPSRRRSSPKRVVGIKEMFF